MNSLLANIFLQTEREKSDKLIKKLESIGTPVFVPAGLTFLNCGTIPSFCYLVESGIVMGRDKNIAGNNGNRLCIFAGSGVLLLYENISMNHPVEMDYSALTNTTLIAIEGDDLFETVKKDKDLFKDLMCLMSSKAQNAERQVSSSKYSADWGYCNFLVMLAKENGENTDDGIRVKVPFTQSELAQYLNVSRTTIHYICAQLQKRGVIKQNKMEIIIRSLEKLKAYLDMCLEE